MDYIDGLHFCCQEVYPYKIRTKFNLIHVREWTGDTIINICKRYGVSRKEYYKWNKRYKQVTAHIVSTTIKKSINIIDLV
jgi:transposase